jgi:hypothetical protein
MGKMHLISNHSKNRVNKLRTGGTNNVVWKVRKEDKEEGKEGQEEEVTRSAWTLLPRRFSNGR